MLNIRKSTRFIIFGILSLLIVLSGCSKKTTQEDNQGANNKSQETQTAEKETDKKGDSITVAVFPDYPPFSFEEKGTASGICVDILKEASKRNNIEVKFEMLPFNRGLEAVKNGKIDAMVPLYKTAEREIFLDFVKEPMVPDTSSFFVPVDSNIVFDGDLNKIKDTVGIVVNNSYGVNFDNAVKSGAIKTEETSDVDGTIKKLIGKRQNIIIGGTYTVLYTAKKLGVSNQLKELKPVVCSEFIMLGFSKKSTNKNLMDKYSTIFQEMKKDGSYDKILNKYKY